MDASFDEKGNIWFTCPKCGIESMDRGWKESKENIEVKDNFTDRIILKIDIKMSKDGTIHFAAPGSNITFCGKAESESVSFGKVSNSDVCDDCLESVSGMLGMSIKMVKRFLNLRNDDV